MREMVDAEMHRNLANIEARALDNPTVPLHLLLLNTRLQELMAPG